MKNKFRQIASVLLFFVLLTGICRDSFGQIPQRWSHTNLSEGKTGFSAAVIGYKIMLFSGNREMGTTQFLVTETELFDIRTGQSQILSIDPMAGRVGASGISVGTKFIFAGGDNGYATDRVDIYDTLTQTWTLAQLSLDRYFISAVSLNGKAVFAGGSSKTAGRPASNVDIYTGSNDSWVSMSLPNYITGLGENTSYRRNIGGIAYGSKAYFAGGVEGVYEDDACKYVSVFNALDNTWMPSLSLSNHKTDLCTGAYGGKIYFAGGTTRYYDSNTSTYITYSSDSMNVYDTLIGLINTVKIPKLLYYNALVSDKRPWTSSVQAGCKMFLIPQASPYGGTNGSPDTIAIYDMARNTWSFEPLLNPRTNIIGVACNNKVYFAGGQNTIGNYDFRDDIDIYNLYPILKTAVNNAFAKDYNFGTIENNTQQQITLQLSNEGDYDLLFDATATYSLTGDLSVFSIDPATLPAVSDTLAPAKILSIPVSFNPISSGTYSAILTIKSNDPAMPVYSFQVNGTSADNVSTGIPNTISASYIKLYPNPSKGIVTIENSGTQSYSRAEIVSPQGMLVKEVQLTGAVTTLDISGLSQGIYFVHFFDWKSSAVVKLVKE